MTPVKYTMIVILFCVAGIYSYTLFSIYLTPQTRSVPNTEQTNRYAEQDTDVNKPDVSRPSTTTETTPSGTKNTPEKNTETILPTTIPDQPTHPSDVSPKNSAVIPEPTTVLPEKITVNWENVLSDAQRAVVNVLCTSSSGGLLNPITASGVVIEESGIILTNAHVAQYLFLDRRGISCTLRFGSPASPRYAASLIYLSPAWVSVHGTELLHPDQTGTGEFDFALLRAHGPTGPTIPFPPSLEALPLNIDGADITPGAPITLVAYPAGFLGGTLIQTNLYQSSAFGSIGELFTFNTTTIDLFSMGSSVLAQRGSSGGAVINANGKLVGIIVTSTDEETTGERDLRAVTLGHIDRQLRAETGVGLTEVIHGSDRSLENIFHTEALPKLRALYEQLLDTAAY